MSGLKFLGATAGGLAATICGLGWSGGGGGGGGLGIVLLLLLLLGDTGGSANMDGGIGGG